MKKPNLSSKPSLSAMKPALKSQPRVHTTAGVVRGKHVAKGTMSWFANIPYAAPPVGDRRWRPPAPVEPWSGERDCTSTGPVPYQRAQNADAFFDEMLTGLGLSGARRSALQAAMKLPRKQSEDCLTLTVRAPAGASDLPVMVWIHGGDHTDGSGTEPFYLSNALPERGCVLVTINYRLGMFGFLCHPELAAESDRGVSGNYGLLDQIAALEWVRDNIAAFGGDPSRVTIFGESAGGQAVLNLLTAPSARGLFHGAIAQSPSDSGRWLHQKKAMLDFDAAEDAGRGFADAVVGPSEGQLRRLRRMPPEALSEHYRNRPEFGRHFYPSVDGVTLPETPMGAFSAQRQAPVPLMIGYNADEGTLLAPFMHPAGAEFDLATGVHPGDVPSVQVRETIGRSYGSEAAADRLLAEYGGLSTAADRIRHAGDHMFGVHVEHASIQHATGGHPTYRYFYKAVTGSPNQTAGAFHAAEIFNVFDSSVPLFPVGEGNHLLTRAMGDHWFAFAATGSPDFPGRPEWPPFDPADRQHMVFDRPTSTVEACPPQTGLTIMRERVSRLIDAAASAATTTAPVVSGLR